MKRIVSLILVLLIAVSTCAVAVSAADLAETSAAGYPELKAVNVTKDGVRITWNSYPNAYKYRVFCKIDNAKNWKKLADTDKLYYDYIGAPMITEIRYTVRAMDKKGNFISGYDSVGFTCWRFFTPDVTKVENIAGGVRLTTYTDNSGYSGFISFYTPKYPLAVFVKGGTYGNSWKLLGYSDKTVLDVPISRNNSGQKLSFTVRYVDTGGEYRSYFNAGKSITHIAAPTLTGATVNGGQKLTVNKVKGAAKYRVFVRENNGWKKLGDTTSSIVNKNIKYGTSYNYTVRALNASGQFISGYYNNGFSIACIAPPQITSITQSYDCLKLSWNKDKQTSFYRIYRKAPGEKSWTRIGDTAATYYNDYDVEPNAKYTYTLRCIDLNGYYGSYYDPAGKSQTYNGTPKIFAAENSDDGIELYYMTDSDRIASYRIFIKEDDKWKAIANSTDFHYTYKNAKLNATYIFTVRGLDKNGKYCTGYYDPGFYVNYRKNAETTVNEDSLFGSLKAQLWGYMEYDDENVLNFDNAMWTFAVDSGCYGDNCGNVTENLMSMGDRRIRDFYQEILDFGFDRSPDLYRIERIKNEGYNGYQYYLLLGYSEETD